MSKKHRQKDKMKEKVPTKISALKEECDTRGIDFVSKRINLSPERINLVLNTELLNDSHDINGLLHCLDKNYTKTLNLIFHPKVKHPPNNRYVEEEWQDEDFDEDAEYSNNQGHHSNCDSEEYYEALEKNQDLVMILQNKRTSFATIGTNKAKRRLNKLSETNTIAHAIRLSLQIEDINITAKKTFGKYRDKVYREKERLILELLQLFINNGWKYGTQESDVMLASTVIYFEIPTVEQLSWHCNINQKLPTYDKKWDEQINSTMDKLERATYKLLQENDLLK